MHVMNFVVANRVFEIDIDGLQFLASLDLLWGQFHYGGWSCILLAVHMYCQYHATPMQQCTTEAGMAVCATTLQRAAGYTPLS